MDKVLLRPPLLESCGHTWRLPFLNENQAEKNQCAAAVWSHDTEQTGRPELPLALFKEHVQLKTNCGQKAASGVNRARFCAAVSYPSETQSHLGTGREGERQQAGQAKCNWT